MDRLEEAQALINSIKNENVREYYQYVLGPEEFFEMYKKFKGEGFVLDLNSGLMFRGLFSEIGQKQIGHTLVEGVFPRPVDLHYHRDTDELIKVLEGKGTFVLTEDDGKIIRKIDLKEGSEIYIPVGAVHSFRPADGEYLVIRLACSKILNPEMEVIVSPFHKYWTYGIEYLDAMKEALTYH